MPTPSVPWMALAAGLSRAAASHPAQQGRNASPAPDPFPGMAGVRCPSSHVSDGAAGVLVPCNITQHLQEQTHWSNSRCGQPMTVKDKLIVSQCLLWGNK